MTKDKLYSFLGDFSDNQKLELGNLLTMFGRYSGLINACLERKDFSELGLHWFQTLSPNMKILLNQRKEISSGGLGIDENPIVALKKSFGESLERYALSVYDSSLFKIKTAKEVSDEYNVLFDNLLEHTGRTKELSEHYASTDEPISWTYVKSLDDSEVLLYPAGQIYIPCDTTKKLSYVTSTGVSFQSNKRITLEAGLLEVIERDALILNHYFVKNFTAINIESIELPLLTRSINNNFKPKFIKLNSDTGVPVVMCILQNEAIKDAGMLFGIGCSAAIKEIDAVNKSLIEALFTFNYSQYLIGLRVDRVNKLKALYEHYLYYQSENNLKLLIKNYPIDKYVDISNIPYRPDLFGKNFEDSLGKMYYKDITTPEINEIGYIVTRVIAPEAYDLHVREIYFNPTSKRVERFKKFCVSKGIGLRKSHSKIPHPMP